MLQRILLLSAVMLAIHGTMLAIFTFLVQPFLAGGSHDILEMISFWILYVPALFLTKPINWLLWNLKLMNSPGWISWPTPIGFLLGYVIWIIAILALRLVLGRITSKLVRTRNRDNFVVI